MVKSMDVESAGITIKKLWQQKDLQTLCEKPFVSEIGTLNDECNHALEISAGTFSGILLKATHKYLFYIYACVKPNPFSSA